jgi:hypothetical protein
MIATNDSITELGDASDIVEIDPAAILVIGETGSFSGFTVTLSSAGRLGAVANAAGDYEYWIVNFTVQSTANEINYALHPVVDSHVQYIQRPDQSETYYYQDLPDNPECTTPAIEIILDGLKPHETFACRFEFMLPADDRNLYWVYQVWAPDPAGGYMHQARVWQMR